MQMSLVCVMMNTSHIKALSNKEKKQHNSLEETQQWLTEGGVISAVKSFYRSEERRVGKECRL